MSDDAERVRTVTWLAEHPVPASKSAMAAWRDEVCCCLGPGTIPHLLHALEEGDDTLQHGALLALRAVGVTAWANGYGPGLVYDVTFTDGASRQVRPSVTGVPGSIRARTIEKTADPYLRIREADQAMEESRREMAELARVRAEAIRELRDGGVRRSEIASRLGLHPSHISRLLQGSQRAS